MAKFKLTKPCIQIVICCTVFIIIFLFILSSTYQPDTPNYISRSYLKSSDPHDDPSNIYYSTSHENQVDLSIELQVILQCSDVIPKRDTHQEQSFWVLENYVPAGKTFKCYESITLTTQGDYTFLDNLQVIVNKWRGPVSVALYAPGDDFKATLESIAYVRNCQSVLVKELVSFHLFYDAVHTPNLPNMTILEAYTDHHACTSIPYATAHDALYKQRHNLSYPINVARNLARRTATTHFVLPTDIELYPSPNFIEKFMLMIANRPSLADADPPRVFVLPLFEVVEDGGVPESKRELQAMLKGKKAFVFHAHLCLQCHKIPKYKEWLEEEESDMLNVFATTKRLGYHFTWEPFFVGTNADPWFDERLSWEGQSNKMTQGLIMCLLDYDYMVLDNAFLVHKPGIKTEKTQMQKYMNQVTSTVKLLNGQIKYELISIYGRREGCQWFKESPKSSSKPKSKRKQ